MKSLKRFLDAPIVNDPTDTDAYKLFMKAAFFRWYPDADAEYVFTCRTPGFDFRPLLPYIRYQIALCRDLSYSPAALKYIKEMERPRFSSAFCSFLRAQRWIPEMVSTECDREGALRIRIRGPVLYTTDWEIWILAIISELRFFYMLDLNKLDKEKVYDDALKRQRQNYRTLLKSCPGEVISLSYHPKFIEFGTRRRASMEWQERVLKFWNSGMFLAGTSNIMFARALNIPVKGTHAHEWDSAHLALTHPLLAKRMAMERWLDTFNGDLGITLTDTFTTDHFLSVFDRKMANAFMGVRHDSGPWDEWTNKIIHHYEKLGIDPKTKTLLYSDGLSFPLFAQIYSKVKNYPNEPLAQPAFGIGTNVTNDCLVPALQIVIKMVSFNGQPVLKISDTPGKVMSEDEVQKAYMLKTFGVKV